MSFLQRHSSSDAPVHVCSVPLSFSWKLLKPHMLVVIKDVIFPVMCFSDADASLWEDDPYDFIRVKYGMIGR